MKKDKDRQVGVRVGLPVFFALELEDVYRHTEGAHRALAFPDFCGLLIGLGLDQYRKQNTAATIGKTTEDIEDEIPEGDEWEKCETMLQELPYTGKDIIPFPSVSLPEPGDFQDGLEAFLKDIGYV
jgi:hypothetical protein